MPPAGFVSARALVLALTLTLGGCTRSPSLAPVHAADPSLAAESEPCAEPPPTVPRELDVPLELTPCAWTLEPPALDREQRAHTRETIAALGNADPFSLQLALEVAFAELAAADWEGIHDPSVHARLRATLAWLEPIVSAPEHPDSQSHDEGLMAMLCMHAVLGEAAPAQALAVQLLNGYGGHLFSRVYLMQAGLFERAGRQEDAIAMYERSVGPDPFDRYAVYRLAWALRHPPLVDEPRAAALLEQLLDDLRRQPYLNMPRLERALAYRAALELRALGREIEVPPLECER
jgi:hypothetical protein